MTLSSLPEDFVKKLTKKDRRLIYYATTVVEIAHKMNITLRIMCAIAITLHSREHPQYLVLVRDLGRMESGESLFTDVDLMAYGSQGNEVKDYFIRLGLELSCIPSS